MMYYTPDNSDGSFVVLDSVATAMFTTIEYDKHGRPLNSDQNIYTTRYMDNSTRKVYIRKRQGLLVKYFEQGADEPFKTIDNTPDYLKETA